MFTSIRRTQAGQTVKRTTVGMTLGRERGILVNKTAPLVTPLGGNDKSIQLTDGTAERAVLKKRGNNFPCPWASDLILI
jgi:hypothetical protein